MGEKGKASSNDQLQQCLLCLQCLLWLVLIVCVAAHDLGPPLCFRSGLHQQRRELSAKDAEEPANMFTSTVSADALLCTMDSSRNRNSSSSTYEGMKARTMAHSYINLLATSLH